MRMKYLLIAIAIITILGGSISLMTSTHYESNKLTVVSILITVLIINVLCAHHLYKEAPSNKIKWALFGGLANFNTILFYYGKNYVVNQWSKGKSILRN